MVKELMFPLSVEYSDLGTQFMNLQEYHSGVYLNMSPLLLTLSVQNLHNLKKLQTTQKKLSECLQNIELYDSLTKHIQKIIKHYLPLLHQRNIQKENVHISVHNPLLFENSESKSSFSQNKQTQAVLPSLQKYLKSYDISEVSLIVYILDDLFSSFKPLLCFKKNLKVSDFLKKEMNTSVKLKASLEMDYLNWENGKWEPVFENFQFTLEKKEVFDKMRNSLSTQVFVQNTELFPNISISTEFLQLLFYLQNYFSKLEKQQQRIQNIQPKFKASSNKFPSLGFVEKITKENERRTKVKNAVKNLQKSLKNMQMETNENLKNIDQDDDFIVDTESFIIRNDSGCDLIIKFRRNMKKYLPYQKMSILSNTQVPATQQTDSIETTLDKFQNIIKLDLFDLHQSEDQVELEYYPEKFKSKNNKSNYSGNNFHKFFRRNSQQFDSFGSKKIVIENGKEYRFNKTDRFLKAFLLDREERSLDISDSFQKFWGIKKRYRIRPQSVSVMTRIEYKNVKTNSAIVLKSFLKFKNITCWDVKVYFHINKKPKSYIICFEIKSQDKLFIDEFYTNYFFYIEFNDRKKNKKNQHYFANDSSSGEKLFWIRDFIQNKDQKEIADLGSDGSITSKIESQSSNHLFDFIENPFKKKEELKQNCNEWDKINNDVQEFRKFWILKKKSDILRTEESIPENLNQSPKKEMKQKNFYTPKLKLKPQEREYRFAQNKLTRLAIKKKSSHIKVVVKPSGRVHNLLQYQLLISFASESGSSSSWKTIPMESSLELLEDFSQLMIRLNYQNYLSEPVNLDEEIKKCISSKSKRRVKKIKLFLDEYYSRNLDGVFSKDVRQSLSVQCELIFSDTLEIIFYDQCLLLNNCFLELDCRQSKTRCVQLGIIGEQKKIEMYSLEEEIPLKLNLTQLTKLYHSIDFSKIETKEVKFEIHSKDGLHLDTCFPSKNIETLKLVINITIRTLSKKFQIFQKLVSIDPKYVLLNLTHNDIFFAAFDKRFRNVRDDDIFYGLRDLENLSDASRIKQDSFSQKSILKNLHVIPGALTHQKVYDLQSSMKQLPGMSMAHHKNSNFEPAMNLQPLLKNVILPKNDKERKPLWVKDDFEYMIKTKEGSWSYKMNLKNFEVFNVSIPDPQKNKVLLLSVEIKSMSGITYVVIQDTVVHDIKIQNELSDCFLECFEMSTNDSDMLLRQFPKRQLPGQQICFIEESFNKKIKLLGKIFCFGHLI